MKFNVFSVKYQKRTKSVNRRNGWIIWRLLIVKDHEPMPTTTAESECFELCQRLSPTHCRVL